MKQARIAPARRNESHIAVDALDPRKATVVHDGKVIFTIRTDASGVNPSIIVVATETFLKSMEKGKTGMVLWNGGAATSVRSSQTF